MDGRIVSEKTLALPAPAIIWLRERHVDTVVCGAISRPLQTQLTVAGITVVPFVAGDLRQVIQASFAGTLSGKAFTMPGCCRRRMCRTGCMRVF